LAGVSINSRTVARDELFIAIHGPRHDGHTYVADALAAGAMACVVAEDRLPEYAEPIRTKLLAVPDTLLALQNLAQSVRTRWGKRVAAVTGSAGKTTTKEILAALLAARFRVLKSEGNLNNEFGLPLQLLRLEETDEAAVVELGMSHSGELKRLAEIARPDVGVVTCVAPVHLEFFASVDEIALAKRELIEGLVGRDSVSVLNADDARVAGFAKFAPGRIVTYGVNQPADFRSENIQDRGLAGTEFDFISASGRMRLHLPLAGRHNISNALAALAAASVWGIGVAEAREVFPKLEATGMRGRILQYEAGFTVINDCYNSNPLALRAMIELLTSTAAEGRHILAAGEMLELGAGSGGDRETFLDHWRARRCGKFRARRNRSGPPCGEGKILRVLRGSRRIYSKIDEAGGPLAGERFARRKNGTHSGSGRFPICTHAFRTCCFRCERHAQGACLKCCCIYFTICCSAIFTR
jgi:UDP-N-acetylmuramoyl-tripeptide--D-alanyl-D-alanine ligase